MEKLFSKVAYIIKHEGVQSLVIRPYKLVIRTINRSLIRAFSLFPIDKKKLVLESQGDYTDNARVFSDYVATHNPAAFELIWLVQKPKDFKNRYGGRFVSRNELHINIVANYHIATAGYFIFSHPYWLTTWRRDQTVINTTHSVAQLKASSDSGQKKLYDYVLTCGEYCTSIRKRTFLDDCEEHFICIGQPRIDLMSIHRDCKTALVPHHTDCRLVLCMQTFKQTMSWDDSTIEDRYALNVVSTAEELASLDAFLKENRLVMVVKIHHLQDMSVIEDTSLANIIYLNDDDLSRYDIQVNELLGDADVLLTDYSSVFYEYLLVDKPIGFLLGDMEAYKRGFMMDNPLEEMPGAKVHDYDELIAFLSDCICGIDSFVEDRHAIRNKVFEFQDACNCERLYDWIEACNRSDGVINE